MVQRPFASGVGFAPGAISSVKPYLRIGLSPAVVEHMASRRRCGHPCEVIGQMEESTGSPHRRVMRGIETEEPHARAVLVSDICPNVDLRKSRREYAGHAPCSRRHAEGNHADPRGSVERFDFEAFRHKGSQNTFRNRPMLKKKIEPLHVDGPWTVRQWPGSVAGDGQ